MKQHQQTIGKSQVYFTPRYITEPLGRFDLDPCTSPVRPYDIAERNVCLPENGLLMRWFGRVWLNPPFHRYERPQWMEKMKEGNTGIMLIPAALETEAFKEYVLKYAHAILFMDHRPHFIDEAGTPYRFNSGCSICLAGYGASEISVLQKSNLGTVWTLKNPRP